MFSNTREVGRSQTPYFRQMDFDEGYVQTHGTDQIDVPITLSRLSGHTLLGLRFRSARGMLAFAPFLTPTLRRGFVLGGWCGMFCPGGVAGGAYFFSFSFSRGPF